MRKLVLILALLVPLPSGAAVLLTTRTLPAGTVITAEDLRLGDDKRNGLSDPSEAIGLQTRITIYEGRPIQASVLQPPRLVTRNQIVRIIYQRGALRIETDARAMSEGAAGDIIRVLNLESRNKITARVNPDGTLSALD